MNYLQNELEGYLIDRMKRELESSYRMGRALGRLEAIVFFIALHGIIALIGVYAITT